MTEDELNEVRWRDLSVHARTILMGAEVVNVTALRPLVNRGLADDLGRPTDRGWSLVAWARRVGA